MYLLQVDLHKFLESDLNDPEERRLAREQMKEFSKLLNKADPEYMGGEEVIEDLQKIQQDLAEKINKSPRGKTPTRLAVARKESAKPKKVAKKKVAKKVSKKKKKTK